VLLILVSHRQQENCTIFGKVRIGYKNEAAGAAAAAVVAGE
jgi:hypothetical protein